MLSAKTVEGAELQVDRALVGVQRPALPTEHSLERVGRERRGTWGPGRADASGEYSAPTRLGSISGDAVDRVGVRWFG